MKEFFGLKGRFCQAQAEAWERRPGNAVKEFFGLKGRFCQPRPKAWETDVPISFRP